MPNDCHNTLVVENLTKEEWETLYKSIEKNEFPSPFVKQPVWTNIPNSEGELPTPDDQGFLRFSDGSLDQRWYAWEAENWGHKWTTYDGCVEDTDPTSGTLRASFSTAWAPPNENCMSKVSEAFPSALFTLKYEEQNEDFFGVTLAQGGVAIQSTNSVSGVQEGWEEKNSEIIERLKAENEDEDEEDLVAELWQEALEDELDIIQEACIGLLKIDLINRLEEHQRRLKAEKRLEELGFPKVDKPNREQNPDKV